MGVYLYTLRAKSRKIVLDGETVDAHPFLYARKLSWGGGWSERERKAEHMREVAEERHADHWRRRGMPKYVIGGEPDVGSYVYTDLPEGYISHTDTSGYPGRLLGRLVQQGRKLVVERWHEVPVQREITYDVSKQLYELCQGAFVVSKVRDKEFFFCADVRDAVAAKLLLA